SASSQGARGLRQAIEGCRRLSRFRPACRKSAAPGSPPTRKPAPTRAPAARCCAWRRSSREPALAGHGAAAAGGDGQRHRRGLPAPPPPPGLHRADPARTRPRRAAHRLRPAAAGAGHLGRDRPHRTGGAHPARHGRADAGRHHRGEPVKPRVRSANFRARLYVVAGVLSLAATSLVVRAVDLQLLDNAFYQAQGNERFLREIPIPTLRGTIFDRNGEPLAVSSPVESVWADPQELLKHQHRLPELAEALSLPLDTLTQRLVQRADREFVYLRRHLPPEAAEAILDLGVPGVNTQREFRRFYPLGEAMAHVLGFTNIDERGQEGLELAFDEWLSGKPGAKRVIRDRLGNVVENVDLVRAAEPGRDLTLSIDRRIQYLAHRELKAALLEYQATAGS